MTSCTDMLLRDRHNNNKITEPNNTRNAIHSMLLTMSAIVYHNNNQRHTSPRVALMKDLAQVLVHRRASLRVSQLSHQQSFLAASRPCATTYNPVVSDYILNLLSSTGLFCSTSSTVICLTPLQHSSVKIATLQLTNYQVSQHRDLESYNSQSAGNFCNRLHFHTNRCNMMANKNITKV